MIPQANAFSRDFKKEGGFILTAEKNKVEGTVKWFSNKKGYGFIEKGDGSGDIFVHHSAIDMPGFRTLTEGEKVVFDVEQNDRGYAAKNVMRS